MADFLGQKKILALVVVLVIGVLIKTSLLNNSTHSPLAWSPYSNRNQTEEAGYLAVLKNSDDSGHVFLSLDKKPDAHSLTLKEGWGVELVSEGRLWNPRICSKVPAIITPGGDIYMFESRRIEGGLYDSFVVWFEYKSKVISELKVNIGKFVGKTMFLDADQNPYFFMKTDTALFLTTINRRTNSIEQKRIRKIGSAENITLSVTDELQPVLEVYHNESFVTDRLILRNGSLEKFTGDTQSNLVTYTDEVHVRNNLQRGFVAEYRLDGPYETKILRDTDVILEFTPEEKIYAYAIGSFTKN